jgi:hypothetical protein
MSSACHINNRNNCAITGLSLTSVSVLFMILILCTVTLTVRVQEPCIWVDTLRLLAARIYVGLTPVRRLFNEHTSINIIYVVSNMPQLLEFTLSWPTDFHLYWIITLPHGQHNSFNPPVTWVTIILFSNENKCKTVLYSVDYSFWGWSIMAETYKGKTCIFFFTMALPAHSGPRPLLQFRNHFSQTVRLPGRVISPSQGRYLNTG